MKTIIYSLFLTVAVSIGFASPADISFSTDTDGDGIPDDADQCPTLPGPATHHGCPVIPPSVLYLFGKDHTPVSFHTASSVILDSCFPMLDSMVLVLAEHPEYKLSIGGHTDNLGSREQNLELSQRRADAVKTYLVKRGIAPNRIIAIGYGPDKPVADNSTSEGRRVNRRVEFELYY